MQKVLRFSPDTCGCSYYIDENGNFVSYEDVIKEQQRRIDSGDPTVNPVLSPPDKYCDCHMGISGQALADAVKAEQKKKANALATINAYLQTNLPQYYSGNILDEVLNRYKSNFDISTLIKYETDLIFQANIINEAKFEITINLIKANFNADRILNIEIPILDTVSKSKLETSLEKGIKIL